MIAGVTWALSGAVAFVFAGTGPADPTGTLYFYLFEGAHAVGDVGGLLALLGFHVRQTPAYGRLGTAGFLLAFIGTALVLLNAVLWLILLEASNTLLLTITWDVALLCLLAGNTVLGIATFRAKVLPRWAGISLITLFPLVMVAAFFDGNGGMMLLLLTLVGLLWLALGYALWPKRAARTEGLPLARA